MPRFVAEGVGLFEAEGLEAKAPQFTTLSSTADNFEAGVSELGTTGGFLAAKPHPAAAALRTMIRAEHRITAETSGMLGHAARHRSGCDHTDLEIGGRRQRPCIDIRCLEQMVHDRWDSLVSFELVLSNAQLPAAIISFDSLTVELEPVGPEGPKFDTKTTRQRRLML